MNARFIRCLICALVVNAGFIGSSDRLRAQQAAAEAKPMLTIDQFRPQPMLRAKRTDLHYAKHPVIDVHTHFGFRLKGDTQALAEFVDAMNRHHIAMCVSLDAELGSESDHCQFLWNQYPDRFLVFVHINWKGSGKADQPDTWACNQPGFVRTVCEQLAVAKSHGISGVKFFKQFGLEYRNSDGTLIRIDDSRFDPIWEACHQLGLPVLIHTGDPAAFFDPIDATNERYEELTRHPEWSFYGKDFPSRESLLAARNRVIARHPDTVFVGAHMAGDPEDLAEVGRWLDEMPNLYVDIASRIAELGRQPYSAREFVIQHQDRVLFGTDGPWPELRLTYYWRFLETRDEYFPYSEKTPPPQGLWNIYGIELPDGVLQKVYFQNTLRLIPDAREKYARACQQLERNKE
jgi:predicted TIM-barrel fold metal-dependent hydrolase